MVNLSSYAIGLSAVLSNSAAQAQQLANNRFSVTGGDPEEINPPQQIRRRGITTNDADVDASTVAAYDNQRTLQDFDLSLSMETATVSAASSGLSSSSASSASSPSAKSAKTKSGKSNSGKSAKKESSAKSNKGSGKAEQSSKSSKTKSGKADGLLPSAALNGNPELIGPAPVIPLVGDCLISKGGTGYPCGFYQSTAALFLDRDVDPRIEGEVNLVYNNVASPGGTAIVRCDEGICYDADSNRITDNRVFYGKAAKSFSGKGGKGSSSSSSSSPDGGSGPSGKGGKGSGKQASVYDGSDDDYYGSDDDGSYDDYYGSDDDEDVGTFSDDGSGFSGKSGGKSGKSKAGKAQYMYCCYDQPQFTEGLTSTSSFGYGRNANVVL